MGRIVSDGTYHYSYDSLGQLTTVKNNAGATVESYVYDGAGNILSAVKNGTTHTYSYGDSNWRDLLTSYDGQSITYDTIGNPLNYLGNTLTWQNGRQLETFTNGTTAISYSYDVNGMRTEKAVIQSGETTNYQYFYNGSTLLQERIGNNTILNFIYTADGKPYALEYSSNNGSSYTTYYYLTNLQGDVISILNSSGTAVVSYSYDSWGKITQTTGTLATTLGKDNPLRYRGYVYDDETGLYYLQSRYYDPQVGRFINADGYASTGQGILGTNAFTYCLNNTVNLADAHGSFAEINFACCSVLSGGFGPTTTGVRDVTEELNAALNKERVIANAFHDTSCSPPIRLLLVLYRFYQIMDHGKEWDIKRGDIWENKIGTPFPGEGVKVGYYGMEMTPEQLGNFTYGFIGWQYGISLPVLAMGSFYAAGFPTDGDAFENEQMDQFYIKLGYDYAVLSGGMP